MGCVDTEMLQVLVLARTEKCFSGLVFWPLPVRKKCGGHPPVECVSARALQLIRAERSSNGSWVRGCLRTRARGRRQLMRESRSTQSAQRVLMAQKTSTPGLRSLVRLSHGARAGFSSSNCLSSITRPRRLRQRTLPYKYCGQRTSLMG